MTDRNSSTDTESRTPDGTFAPGNQITSNPRRNTSMKKTTTPTLVELEEQLAQQEAEAANLRSERTDSILSGKEFDQSRLRDAEDKIGAIEQAIAEFRRREIEAAKLARAEAAMRSEEEKWQAVCERIALLLETRRSAIEAMEKTSREAMKHFANADTARRELFRVLDNATGQKFIALIGGDFERQIAQQLSAVIAKTAGKHSFGDIKLMVGLTDASLPWITDSDSIERQVREGVAAHEMNTGLQGNSPALETRDQQERITA